MSILSIPQSVLTERSAWMAKILTACAIFICLTLQTAESFSFGGEKTRQTQLDIAFVTGNEMKVNELTKILIKEGAIDPENDKNSLGTSVVHAFRMRGVSVGGTAPTII